MSVYNTSEKVDTLYDDSGIVLDNAYDIAGAIIHDPYECITSYEAFYPNDADGQYETLDYRNIPFTSDEFLAEYYDDYVTNPPAGITVTKRSLGKDSSGTYDIYEYTFTPTHPKRKVMIMGGEHASEVTAQFGVALLIKHIYSDANNHAFEYIRKSVELKIIPVMNPWGASQKPREYPVAGGENPERNFDYNGLWEMFTSTGDYYNKKGDSPFSAAESKIYAQWDMDNQDADFIINTHTGEPNTGNIDLWLKTTSDTPIIPAIREGFRKNEEIFKNKFGQTARSQFDLTPYPNSTGYGTHAFWKMFCVRSTSFTIEQTPRNTIFGNGKNLSAGAINNYASVTATYLMEMLLDKYQPIYDSIHPNDKIPIRLATGRDVVIGANDYSCTISLILTPINTTQFTFDWVSSNTSVCEVWGCTEQAVVIKRGTGTATLTATNRLNNQIVATCNVVVN